MRKLPPSAIRLRGIRYSSLAGTPTKVWLNNTLLSLDKSLRIKSHTIHGFGWGTDSRGAAQLALAICVELYPSELARQVAPFFKALFLDGINGENFDVNLNMTAFNEVYLSQLV
jgi:hypothetical protein